MTSQKLTPFRWRGELQSNFYVDQFDTLYFKKGHAGRKIKFSCKLKSKDFLKAKQFANKKLSKLINPENAIVRTLIKDELAAWLLVKESEELAPDTMNNIRRAKMQIEWFWGNQFPSDITRDNIPVWFDWWKREHSDIDMENAIKYMRNFCRYLSQKIVRGLPLLPAIPSMKDPNLKKIRKRRKKKKENIFTLQDFHKILSTAASPRDKLLILIMYTMATRVTETLEMKFGSEVCFIDNEWIYRWSEGQNKADLEGWHVFPAHLQSKLTKHFDQSDGVDNLFPQLNDQAKALKSQQIDWAEWRKRAKLPHHWTAHTFRHTCLSNLFNDATNPQALICILYRVSLAVALETYVHATKEGRAALANAIKVEL